MTSYLGGNAMMIVARCTDKDFLIQQSLPHQLHHNDYEPKSGAGGNRKKKIRKNYIKKSGGGKRHGSEMVYLGQVLAIYIYRYRFPTFANPPLLHLLSNTSSIRLAVLCNHPAGPDCTWLLS